MGLSICPPIIGSRAALPPVAICTYFLIAISTYALAKTSSYIASPYKKEQQELVSAQLLSPLEMHWGCASCTVPLYPSTIPPQHSTILYSAHRCSHNTQSFHNSVFPLLEHPHVVPGPPKYAQCQKPQENFTPSQSNIPPMHCNPLNSPGDVVRCDHHRPQHPQALEGPFLMFWVHSASFRLQARAPLGIGDDSHDRMRFQVHHHASCASQSFSRWLM